MLLQRSSQVYLLILINILLTNVECRQEVWTCETKTDQECDFPFTYKGKTYENCTTDALDDKTKADKAWCATETDEDGVMLEGKHDECDFDSCEFVKTGFNGGMVGGLIGAFSGVGVAMCCSFRYMKKNQKGCFKKCANSTTLTQ